MGQAIRRFKAMLVQRPDGHSPARRVCRRRLRRRLAVVNGLPMEHGWIVRDEVVIDPTLPDAEVVYFPGREFQGRDGIARVPGVPARQRMQEVAVLLCLRLGGCHSPSFYQAQADAWNSVRAVAGSHEGDQTSEASERGRCGPCRTRCVRHQHAHQSRRTTTTNHAFGPPSLKVMSFKSGRTSYLAGSMDSMAQPAAKASCSSLFDTRLGPCVPGSSSLKQSRNNRPPGFRTVASPST